LFIGGGVSERGLTTNIFGKKCDARVRYGRTVGLDQLAGYIAPMLVRRGRLRWRLLTFTILNGFDVDVLLDLGQNGMSVRIYIVALGQSSLSLELSHCFHRRRTEFLALDLPALNGEANSG